MFVGPDADPRGIGGIFVHHGDERTVLAGYLHDYRLTLELKCAGLDALAEDLIGELPVARARASCSVPAIMAKTLSVFTRAEYGSSGARRAAMSSMTSSRPSVHACLVAAVQRPISSSSAAEGQLPWGLSSAAN